MHYNEFIKLQKGDIVICNESYVNQFTKGKYYEVNKIYDYGRGNQLNYINVVCDDGGDQTNGWLMKKFDLAPVAPVAPNQTMSPQVLEPEPTSEPTKSKADAIWELLKMAAKQ